MIPKILLIIPIAGLLMAGFACAAAWVFRGQNSSIRPRGNGVRVCLWTVLIAVLAPMLIRAMGLSHFSLMTTPEVVAAPGVVPRMPSLPSLPPPTSVVLELPDIDPPTTQQSPTGKLWVDSWQRFRNTRPPGTNWIRADSAGYFATDDQALQSAYDRAIPLIEATIRNYGVPQGTARQQIATALRAGGGLVSDQYLEHVNRPYGELWRCSLLIDLTPARARQISNATLAAARSGNRQQMTVWASALGMILVLVLTYFFLNAATKGYFVWKLRAAVVMMLIVTLLLFYGNLRI